MKDLNLMSLDMEYNMPSAKIIQIGIIVGNLKSGEILEEYENYVQIDEPIIESITKLTGITDQNCQEEGKMIDEIYENLCELHTKYKCFRNPLTWGGGDSQDLRRALELDNEKYLFGRRWIDVKTLFISRCLMKDEKYQSGLAKSLRRMGLQFKGKKHTAKDDALNTFLIYRELLKEFKGDKI